MHITVISELNFDVKVRETIQQMVIKMQMLGSYSLLQKNTIAMSTKQYIWVYSVGSYNS